MNLGGRVCHFDRVSFAVNCFSIISFVLRLFDLTFLLSMKRDRGALKLDPRHYLNLTKLDSFVDGVWSPHFGGDLVTLNAEKVNKLSAISLLVFSLCKSFKKKTMA